MPWKVPRASPTNMKKRITQLRKQTLDLDSADLIGAGAMDNSATGGTDNDQILAEVVWKYFAEAISETLNETQAALAPKRSDPTD